MTITLVRTERAVDASERWRDALVSSRIQAVLRALDARDGYVRRHSEAVVRLAALTGTRLGLDDAALGEVMQVALLHDVGKVALPERLLRKPGPLDDDEWKVMRRHTEIGAEIVASVPELAHLAPAVRAAHERWDGTGYPDGLAAHAIPLASRIVFLCDAYDAIVSQRPYRAGATHEQAVRELRAGAGTQFCPGSVVALTSSW
jgi:two-component system cell cycle response regulator